MVNKNTTNLVSTNDVGSVPEDTEWLVVVSDHHRRVQPSGSFDQIHENNQNVNETSVEGSLVEGFSLISNATCLKPDLEAWTCFANQIVDSFMVSQQVLGKNWRMIVILLFVSVIFCQNLYRQQGVSFNDGAMRLDGPIKQSNYTDQVLSLGQRIAELQEANERYASRLSRLVIESSNWRSLAVSCRGELKEISRSFDALEEAVMNAKRVVPIKKAMSSTGTQPAPSAFVSYKNISSVDASQYGRGVLPGSASEMAVSEHSAYKSILVMGSKALTAL